MREVELKVVAPLKEAIIARPQLLREAAYGLDH